MKIFKKIFIILVIIFIVCNLSCFADIELEVFDELELEESLLEVSAQTINQPIINSRAAVVIDRDSHTVLYGKNEKEPRAMASTTKIMTCIIVLENANLQDEVIVSKKSAGTGGSRLGLKTNDKITVNDLLYGLMLCSGNDAAVALAEYIGGNVDEFVALMNKKAEELGLQNTHFVTPHGLDADGHYTTAYELAVIADYGLGIDKFKEIVETKSYTVNINGNYKTLNNTNELLGNLNGVYGVKTGFTNGANRCLVTAIKRGNLDVICVVLGADTKKNRTSDSIKLIEYVFDKYNVVDIEEIVKNKFENYKEEYGESIIVEKGIKEQVEIELGEIEVKSKPLTETQKNSIEIIVHCTDKIEAPVEEKILVGNMQVVLDGEILENIGIYTKETVRRKKCFDYFKYFILYLIK